MMNAQEIPCGRPSKHLCGGGPECLCKHGEPAREQSARHKVANDAAFWVVEVMRGSDRDTLYAQAVMEKARDHIQRLVLLLHDAQ